ncbi:imm11 family protein [Archangium lansingense]|uniref:Immunity MXAN-0049 protein domain-containing protein n=1 Tax=Archangium lansingense TaxID=2995310 RepID=A0ABT4ALS1_9BACT|nr:DUF1629 domain-containing protein [Archangium lansinium]MCY1082650.1 hypothetical protein [Archangium lansinium]
MRYYLIDLMPEDNPDFCFLDSYPEGLGLKTYKLGKGQPLKDDYPADARIYMSDKEKGIQVPDLVGNSRSMLITSQRVKEVIERVNQGPTEYLRVAIYNHKKRVASPDHFILNPLGVVDCLNLRASEIEYFQGKVVHVDRLVLDPGKLEKAPELFRVRENSRAYVISDRIVDEVEKLRPGVSNFWLEELDQEPSREQGGKT